MKRMNERVEKRMEELGLDKNDMRSIDIAMESIDAEEYDRSSRIEVSSNPEGLWLGGMDMGRKRDLHASLDLNAPVGFEIDWNEGEDKMDVAESKLKYARGALGLGFGGDNVYVGESSSIHHTQGAFGVDFRLALGGDDMEVGESSSRQLTQGALELSLGLPLQGDDMDIDGGNSSRQAHEDMENGQVSDESEALANMLAHLASAAIIVDNEFRQPNAIVRPQFPQPAVEGANIQDYIEEQNRQYLREVAHHFARCEPPAEYNGTPKPIIDVEQLGSSGGPFWDALKKVRARTLKTSAEKLIKWTPSMEYQDRSAASSFVPSLLELSLEVLAKNANSITSLNHIPYFLQKKLIDRLCDTRKINIDNFNLLLEGCPTELRVKNCSWLTDDQFDQSLRSWRTGNLMVLQLDLGGQICFDYALRDRLAQSPDSFSKLVVLSLRGACRLTDCGLEILVMSAPALKSVNLGNCSLLTFKAVKCIADCLGKRLKELFIDGCEKIKAMEIVNSLKNFETLEVFSVAGLVDVSDGFILELVSVCGGCLKDLDVANCLELTDSSLKAIASHCPGLLALNISRLLKLTDVGMEFLANGCRSIERLNLTKAKFSDEVIAAFIDTSGGSLTELTLNYVSQVGPNTALSLSRGSRNLAYLDISWCRKLTTYALGMIVDSCLSLKLLKVFGCKQIDRVFLRGHSNPLVRIIGFGLMPILEHVNLLEPEEVFLRYSPLPTPPDS